MCSFMAGGRLLTNAEKVAQIDSELRFARKALEDAEELPARIAWLEQRRAELVPATAAEACEPVQ